MSQHYSIKLQKFDLIVIGAGSGLEVANAAYQHEQGTLPMSNLIFV